MAKQKAREVATADSNHRARPPSPTKQPRLDIEVMAERQEAASGSSALSQWPRLLGECHEEWAAAAASNTPVHWRLSARMQGVDLRGPKPFVDLQAQAKLGLVCQRCLGAVEMAVQATRTLRFEPDEATAAAEDANAQEDVLALTPAPDWAALVEDELLLAMPPLPVHDTCPAGVWETYTRPPASVPWAEQAAPAVSAAAASNADLPARKPSPFAVLAGLRTPET